MPASIVKPLKRFAAYFLEARTQDLNEADTVQRICRFCEEVLGYDGLSDISREANLKGKFVDICLKIEGRIRILLEAKAAGVQLRDRHIEQAQAYASQNNFRWVLLTNGVEWNLYHLTFDEGIEYERAFAVSVETPDSLTVAAEKLAYLHKNSVRKGELDEFWELTAALGPESIGKALFKEAVIRLLRREIRRDTGLLIDPEDLGRSLHEMMSAETRELIGPMRIRRRRQRRDAEAETPQSLSESGMSNASPGPVAVAAPAAEVALAPEKIT